MDDIRDRFNGLVSRYIEDGWSSDVNDALAELLGSDEHTVFVLAGALKSGGEVRRGYVLGMLVEVLDANGRNDEVVKAVVSAVIVALRTEDGGLLDHASALLAEIDNAVAIDSLINALAHEHSGVRFNAVRGLGNMRDVKGVPALLAALRDRDFGVRAEATLSLVKISIENPGDTELVQAVPKLIRLLNNFNSMVRWRAAKALGEIGDKRAVSALIEIVFDADLVVVDDASEALVKIFQKNDLDLIQLQSSLQEQAQQIKEPDRLKHTIRRAASLYAMIANAVKERKQKDMPGVLSEGKIKPKKPGMYRTRRAMAR